MPSFMSKESSWTGSAKCAHRADQHTGNRHPACFLTVWLEITSQEAPTQSGLQIPQGTGTSRAMLR